MKDESVSRKVNSTEKKNIKFSPIEKNDSFKVLIGKCQKGEGMKSHLSDKDAFLMVQRGEILFALDGVKHHLGQGKSISIPKNTAHSFEVLEDGEVFLILDVHAKLRFLH